MSNGCDFKSKSRCGCNLIGQTPYIRSETGVLPFMLRLLPFAFLLVPLTEIAVFVIVGQWIGIFPTIALVIITAILGASLLRHQGFGLLAKLQTEMNAGRVPARDLAHGAMIVAAGVLLLTPGFVTDSLGLLLFVPAIRDRVVRFLSARVSIITPQGATPSGGNPFERGAGSRNASRNDGNVIDLDKDEYQDIANKDVPRGPGDNPSGSDRTLH
jgi:UPF0716 protein FxsA